MNEVGADDIREELAQLLDAMSAAEAAYRAHPPELREHLEARTLDGEIASLLAYLATLSPQARGYFTDLTERVIETLDEAGVGVRRPSLALVAGAERQS